MITKSVFPRFPILAALSLMIGCSPAQNSVKFKEGNDMPPKFIDGMTLLEENICSSFIVRYYTTPSVTLADLQNARSEKGWSGIVVPKDNVRLSQVLYSKADPIVVSKNFFIKYKTPSGDLRDITHNAMDHAAPPEAATVPSALFQEDGVFSFGGSYRSVLASRTNGEYGQGEITIDDQAASIFRGNDGSSCTIQPPKIRFQIK